MFTGIIEEMGEVIEIKKGVNSSHLTLKGNIIFEDLKLGDSVAVNGVCLTVTDLKKDTFTADVSGETLKRSSLGRLKIGSKVNLERAMAANGRFGGHIVLGHVDGTGVIAKKDMDGIATWITIHASQEILRYIIHKGSVTVDGISLTVSSVDEKGFSITIIPHTGNETTLLQKKIGDIVNLENDMVGKYIEQFLMQPAKEEKDSNITLDYLIKNGF
ncbi:riboflavin synthase [Anaerosacchariphilus polymeriproducens]|uniref:Riboflavin synthase n=1 Tax=Anaerosacchariphilus polymeriproducens TaxID=1812858 RepID=A0A371AWE7_9FIRM|nr:riboflavin synthase [Anaerosacchariphilus polymeriproducens]RDU23898.1 riboflavin synthase [Anaerosacchariphilus polymeriproducens]